MFVKTCKRKPKGLTTKETLDVFTVQLQHNLKHFVKISELTTNSCFVCYEEMSDDDSHLSSYGEDVHAECCDICTSKCIVCGADGTAWEPLSFCSEDCETIYDNEDM